jgi:signal transduction histidine kinase
LIINAFEAMRDVDENERELLVSSRNEPDGVSVEVRDSGPGFAPADLDRVFEAFYTTKSDGLGHGLSICRSIIEAHNGRLWASPNVPHGAIFGFVAPAHPVSGMPLRIEDMADVESSGRQRLSVVRRNRTITKMQAECLR